MKMIWEWVKNNPNRTMFLIPIILVAGISISHVVTWYDIANPFNWAIYLSIAIEVGAMTALVAATNKIKGGVFFMFGLITIIQMIGNIFYSFQEIEVDGKLFKSWVELTSPLWEMLGSDSTDSISMKRWLAFLEGGLLPIISLTSLHFFVKYDKGNKVIDEPITEGLTEGLTDDMINKFSDLQESAQTEIEDVEEVNETTETISDDIREIVEDEIITTENTKFPIDKMLEMDDNIEDKPKRLIYKGKDA
jgi:hypothetical protein